MTTRKGANMSRPLSIPPTSAAGRLTPKFAEVTNEVLFGDVWERPDLSKRDRSLIVVSALLSLGRADQLKFHLEKALDHGVTKDELAEVITHLAFYAGWPAAVTAVGLLDQVLAPKTTDATAP
jgi:4-carboxymuconolactone decarboxylase